MGKTVIDQLVVELGLDSSNYKKGKAAADAATQKLKQTAQADAQATEVAGKKTGKTVNALGRERKQQADAEKKRRQQAEKDRKRSSDTEKKSTDEMIGRLKTLGIAAAGAVLGFKTLEGAIQAYAATSGNLANLGRLAPTVGASAAGLNILGNAYKQVGGTQADANADVSKIAAAQFSWQMHNPDQFAAMARNLGVGLFDSRTGKERSKVAILTDIGNRLRAMTPDVQAQAMYARQMGLSEASIQLFLVDQARTRRQILQDAIATNAVTKQGVSNAIALSTAAAQMKNRFQAVKDAIVSKEDASLATGLTLANDSTVPTSNRIAALLIGLVGGFGQRDLDALQGTTGTPKKYASAFAAADKKYGLRPGTLETIAWQESRYNPNAVSKKGARGIMQLEPRFFPGAGKNAYSDIDTAGAEFARLLRVYGGNYKLALAAYNAGQGTVDKYRSGAIKRLPAETRAYVPSVLGHMPGAAGAASTAAAMPSTAQRATAASMAPPTAGNVTTNVEIDSIIVNTQAKDANGIAASLPDALKRKGVVASANSGMS